MMTIDIGLACEDNLIPLPTLMSVAAAINKQVQDEFGPLWKIQARVSPLPDPAEAPRDSWVVVVVRTLDRRRPGSGQVGTSNRPWTLLRYQQDWSFSASQACLELIVRASEKFELEAVALSVDAAGEITDDPSLKFKYLLEICSPCNSIQYRYFIDNWPVSDFALPSFYDGQKQASSYCSFKSHLKTPRRPLPGGYISWLQAGVVTQLWKTSEGAVHKQSLAIEDGAFPQAISRRLAGQAGLRALALDPEHLLLLSSQGASEPLELAGDEKTKDSDSKFVDVARECLFIVAGWLGMVVLLIFLALLILGYWMPLHVAPDNYLPVPVAALLRFAESALIAIVLIAAVRLAPTLRGKKSTCHNIASPLQAPFRSHEADERMMQHVRNFIIIFMFGNVFWIFAVGESVGKSDGLPAFFRILGTLGILSGACLISGALLGFIFGIPRSVTDPAPASRNADVTSPSSNSTANDLVQSGSTARVEANTNLEQISDWLTKLLVGVGLSKIEKLPESLKSASAALNPVLGQVPNGGAIGVAVCCAFGVAGFSWGYFEARTSLMRVFANAESP